MKKRLLGILGSIVASIALVGLASPALAGHPAAECQKYATDAVNQFNELSAAGCHGKPGDTAWGNNYQGHYSWCLSTKADIHEQFKQRRLAIDQCKAHSDQICHAYAADAISQVNAFVKKGCILDGGNPSLWGSNPQDHYNWCKANVGADLAQQHKLRRVATDTCQTAATAGSGGASSISVTSQNGKNAFIVAGTGFLPNRKITIRITGAGQGGGLSHKDYNATADSRGVFRTSVGGVCASKGILYFVATDGTDLSRATWTKPVTSLC